MHIQEVYLLIYFLLDFFQQIYLMMAGIQTHLGLSLKIGLFVSQEIYKPI